MCIFLTEWEIFAGRNYMLLLCMISLCSFIYYVVLLCKYTDKCTYSTLKVICHFLLLKNGLFFPYSWLTIQSFISNHPSSNGMFSIHLKTEFYKKQIALITFCLHLTRNRLDSFGISNSRYSQVCNVGSGENLKIRSCHLFHKKLIADLIKFWTNGFDTCEFRELPPLIPSQFSLLL